MVKPAASERLVHECSVLSGTGGPRSRHVTAL